MGFVQSYQAFLMVAPCGHWGLRDNIFSFVHPGWTRRCQGVYLCALAHTQGLRYKEGPVYRAFCFDITLTLLYLSLLPSSCLTFKKLLSPPSLLFLQSFVYPKAPTLPGFEPTKLYTPLENHSKHCKHA
ncbi:Protein of unknown function [Pyronema omphalodes CBS 100304]|uniref:Uncharacterized protein n=1 Tax=Pyronema omphalodes (strain CBS 100304) TaxID=1076935 RepID=U4LLR6_PYROM|nr:Protein of unknown function [Pyronema omphalodes CBS 100304]